MSALPAAVAGFVDRYLEDTVTLELVTYLHDNPDLYQPLLGLARGLGRKLSDIEPQLNNLVKQSLVQCYPDERGEIQYMLCAQGETRRQMEAFFKACEDPQVRVKALYRIIRRRARWQ